jgi:hypothetical protein
MNTKQNFTGRLRLLAAKCEGLKELARGDYLARLSIGTTFGPEMTKSILRKDVGAVVASTNAMRSKQGLPLVDKRHMNPWMKDRRKEVAGMLRGRWRNHGK